MYRGHAVGAVRADDGEVGHADLPLRPLLDQAHALNTTLVSRKTGSDGADKSPIDLEDDL